ncbi:MULTISPECIES: metalloregulator ArsR/SmtB family transcription factor [unclassified Micromonospora]|uniref:ArsR/SmtB family transcription factor n=1 Tax=unclassified Micromonospora TaxID=2617518 RepID=UPI001C21C32D|nr:MULTISPECIES: metalloregulator ArsR/SmtB family transcription factor [unclassified Micromonospora]MBU8861592.1 metalloregulator ArsR/SmtB family transcription factor [Micromonospora sp. WMMB482]MDM4781160.1 metalloregulator ArsR/SmtB family transcription factor [Micromonospora sp. b486]
MAKGDRSTTKEPIETAAAVLQALASPIRLRVVLDVIDREATAAELAERLGVGYTTVAKHLRHLRVAGLVRRHRSANHVRYLATPSAVLLVRAILVTTGPRGEHGNPVCGALPRH